MNKEVSRQESSLAPLGWPFRSLQREVNRVFRDFFDDSGLPDTGFGAGLVAGVPLKMDIAESDEAFEVTAELPGIDEKDVDVSVAEGVLTIKGEKKAEQEEK